VSRIYKFVNKGGMNMEDLYWFFKRKFVEINSDNSGVAVIEIILILVDIFIFNYICVSSI
ncbi:MAG: hypothetical protein IKH94_04285, partial [Eubacterium sp.]|nr:hypothetical protein [Eubacterium sp.]